MVNFIAMFKAMQKFRALLLTGMLFAHCGVSLDAFAAPSVWRTVAEDLEIAQASVPGGGFFSSELVAFRTKLTRFSFAVIKASELGLQRSTAKALADSAGAVLAINANYFDEFGRPLGLILSRGITAQGIHRRGNTLTGIFSVSPQGGARIVSRGDFSADGVTMAVQAGPRLVSNGKATVGLDGSDSITRRSGVCIDKAGAVIFFITSSRLGGVTLSQLATPLIDGFGCVDALNLDGGGSSQLFFRGTSESLRAGTSSHEQLSLEGQDLIPVAIGLVPRSS